MHRPVERKRPRAARAPGGAAGSRAAPWAAGPEAAVLWLQAEAGNAAVTRMLARAPSAQAAPDASAHFRRALADYQAGRYEEALEGFAAANALHPAPEFLYNEAACLDKLGRLDEAADMYERYVTAAPGAADAAKVRAHAAKLRSRSGARTAFDRGQDAFAAGDFATAAEAFGQAFALEPLPAFVFNRAAALEKLGRHAAAANALEHYLLLAPTALDAQATSERIRKLREAATKDPIVDPWADEERAPAVTATGKEGASEWFTRGRLAYDLGDYHRSYDCFFEAFELFPQPEFAYNQAAALHKLGDAEAAIQGYERYLALAPGASDADRVRRAIAKLRDVAGRDALMDPEDEEATAATDAATWFDRGTAAYAANRFRRSYDCFVRAYELHPAPELAYNQAAALHKLGRADAAVQAYERYLALAPGAPDADRVRRAVRKLRGR